MEVKTKTTIYKLGRHTLICGDSTDKATVLAALEGIDVQAIITDPPYRMDYSGAGCFTGSTVNVRGRIAGMLAFDPHSIGFYAELDAPSIYVFCSKNQLYDYLTIFKDYNCTPCVWCKTNPTPFCASGHLPDVEYLLYFSRRGRVWNAGLKPMSIYSRFYVSSKEEGKFEAKNAHPTVKPLTLIRNKIRISNSPGGTVFDPFGGSGTTLIAAEQTGRRCVMIEQDPEYCQTIISRWEQETGEKAERI